MVLVNIINYYTITASLLLAIIFLLLTTVVAKSQTDSREAWIPFEDTTKQLFGFKDLQGNIKVSPRYWDITTDTFRSIAFVGELNNGWICIDRNLNKLFKPYIVDNGIDFFQSGLIRIQENNKIGFADTTGKIIIPPIYDFALPFDKSFTAFYSGGKYVCLEKGVPDSLCEHMGWTGGLWGFVNKKNDTLIPPALNDTEIADLNIASLTDKNPNSSSYLSIKGKNKTYYIENVRKTFDDFFNDFLTEAERKNTTYFKSICYPDIKCTYCLLNTKQEYGSLVKAKLYYPGNFYTEIQDKEIFPASEFISRDFNLVFSKQAIANLKDTSKTVIFIDFEYCNYLFPFTNNNIFLQYLDKQQRYFKITAVVSHYKNGTISYQEYYEFLKTDDGIKFIAYDRTIDGYGQ